MPPNLAGITHTVLGVPQCIIARRAGEGFDPVAPRELIARLGQPAERHRKFPVLLGHVEAMLRVFALQLIQQLID
jgi:hypothetical protein